MGLTCLMIPEKYGGTDGDLLDLVIIHEEMCRFSPAISMSFGVASTWGSHKIANFGNERQKEDILPRIVRGEVVFSAATTESDAGSDVLGGIRATAETDDNEFVINAEKTFISAANIADYIIVLCITDPDVRRVDGLSQIIVEPKKVQGFSVSAPCTSNANWRPFFKIITSRPPSSTSRFGFRQAETICGFAGPSRRIDPGTITRPGSPWCNITTSISMNGKRSSKPTGLFPKPRSPIWRPYFSGNAW